MAPAPDCDKGEAAVARGERRGPIEPLPAAEADHRQAVESVRNALGPAAPLGLRNAAPGRGGVGPFGDWTGRQAGSIEVEHEPLGGRRGVFAGYGERPLRAEAPLDGGDLAGRQYAVVDKDLGDVAREALRLIVLRPDTQKVGAHPLHRWVDVARGLGAVVAQRDEARVVEHQHRHRELPRLVGQESVLVV